MKKRWDWLLFLLIIAIGSISLLIIFSINKTLATNQLIFWGVGLLVLIFLFYFDYKIWIKFSPLLYIASLFFLLLLLIIGDPVRGSVRWLDLGAFRFQPSEVAKATSILVLSVFYFERSARDLKNVFLSFLIILPAFILVLIQPDIGNSLTFIAIWFGISFICGFRPKHIFTLIVLAVITSLLLFRALAPYQKERINSFINPQKDPLGTGYQIIQAKIAAGSGKFWGRGLGRSSQSQLKFLPEAESDFIFASIAEQLGFIGAGLTITLYTLFVTRIINLIKLIDRFGQLIATGVISYLLLQFLVNVGMNMALVPVTGITLPLVSYGGSSLISTLFLLGIIFSIRRPT